MLRDLINNDINEIVAINVVKSLLQTSLRGVDSHGINLFPHYCKEIDAGRINKSPNIKITHASPCSILIDADHTFGHHAGILAIEEGSFVANEYGMSGVVVRNSTHFGAASYFGLHAAQKDLICIAFTNADALVKAYGSSVKYFGTNPLCFCAPMLNEEPFCLDMATSQISWNKIREYSRNSQPIPNGLAFDNNGQITTDPDLVSMLAPIGEYKGYGLGMMVDILCALLGTGLTSKDIIPMFEEPLSKRRYISHYFILIDINKYVDAHTFKKRLQLMADEIRNLKKQSGFKKVMVAGDPEKSNYTERISSGIPVYNDIYQQFLQLSPKYKEALVLGK